jgi:Arc/MetJ-type ribon-helix-helix transcriptional regulator
MNTGAFPAVQAPIRRRRSSAADPLKKLTVQLSESVVDAIKALVRIGEAPSTSVFVENAVRAGLRERRRTKIYAAYEEAANDPAFIADVNADTRAFDNTLRDGLAG